MAGHFLSPTMSSDGLSDLVAMREIQHDVRGPTGRKRVPMHPRPHRRRQFRADVESLSVTA